MADEPTNHLDEEARGELAAALAGFRGVGILVSHDRELVDLLAERCASFEPDGVVVRPGGYSSARAQAERERGSVAAERLNARRELARLAAEKDARAHEAARADVLRSKGRVDPRDHAAKFTINRARFTGKDGHAGRVSAQMDARLAAAEKRLAAAYVHKRYDGDLWLDVSPSRRATGFTSPPRRFPAGRTARSRCPSSGLGAATTWESSAPTAQASRRCSRTCAGF